MAGGRGRTQTTNEIPDELKPLIENTAALLVQGQEQAPIDQFLAPNTQQIAGLAPAELMLMGDIFGQGMQQGPSYEEQLAESYGRRGYDAAARDTSYMNYGDARGLQSINQMLGIADQPIADPRSDAYTWNQLNRGGNTAALPYTGGDTQYGQSASWLNALGSLATNNPQDVTNLESEALGSIRQLSDQAGQQFPTLSAPEGEALGQYGGLAEINQQQTGGITSPELRGMTYLNRAAEAGTENLPLLYAPGYQSSGVLQPFVQGELGESPATQAAMKAWREQALPEVETALALRGMENSGAASKAITESATQAYIPLVQQELQQRMQAVPLLQQLDATMGTREREDAMRALQAGTEVGGQFTQLGSELARRGMSDQERRVAQGLDIARSIEGVGGTMAERQRGDLEREVALGRGLAGDIAGIGALAADRERQDLAASRGTEADLANLWQGLGETMSSEEMAQRGQQFDQASGLASQYQALSEMLAAREREDVMRQMGAYGTAAGMELGYGTDVAGREAENLGRESGAAFQLADLERTLGSEIENRDFDQLLQALSASGQGREVTNQQAEAEYQDYLRRQALAEQMLLAPISGGVLTSGIGQTVNSRQSGMIPGLYK